MRGTGVLEVKLGFEIEGAVHVHTVPVSLHTELGARVGEGAGVGERM